MASESAFSVGIGMAAEGEAVTIHPLARGDRLKLASVCDEAIIPRLHGRPGAPLHAVPLADPHAIELARMLVGAEPKAGLRLIDSLSSDHHALGTLCAKLLEPTARELFDLWKSDECSEFDVTLALNYLQIALHHASLDAGYSSAPAGRTSRSRSVLVAPSPSEPHMLCSVIASELFSHAGWRVSREFPTNDAALGALLHAQWYDVLELSLSSTFLREHRLAALARSIRAAHAASLNPGIVVIVDGRVFHDRPQAFMQVGADASNANAMDIVSTAQAHSDRPHSSTA